jgi:hypothetical protein
MNLKEILAKLAKGEALTDAEKDFLAKFDPQKAIDDAAAAARRKSETDAKAAKDEADAARRERDDLKAQAEEAANKGKPEIDRLKADNEKLKAKIVELEKTVATLSGERQALTRDAKLTKIIQGSGLDFVQKVDRDAMIGILKNRFGDLKDDELEDATKTKPILDAFRSANEAVIADTSGHGSGGDPLKRLTFKGAAVKNPWKKETRNLTLQGAILKEDPALARRLQAEAGISLDR